MPLELDTSAWSGEGTFTQLFIDRLAEGDSAESYFEGVGGKKAAS